MRTGRLRILDSGRPTVIRITNSRTSQYMANEFNYCVSLSIVHPSVDAAGITKVITILRPRIETTAGTARRGKGGKPLSPSRMSPLSHWCADLHREEKLYSGSKPFSEFLLEQANKLEPYRDLFVQLRQEGAVTFMIGLFSKSNCAADVLKADMLRKCGDLGIDIELNYYAPEISKQRLAR
jgi:hypothetical protein